jgi:hypothetical protein
MPRYDRLSILVSLTLFGLVVSQVIELPTRTMSFVALGVPTTIYLSGWWFIGALLVILVGTGMDSIVRSHPRARNAVWEYSLSFWGVPCAFTLLSLFLLPLSPDKYFWLAGLALTGILLALLIIAQYHTIDQRDPYYGVARWGLNLVVYASITAFCALIYGARARSLLSATAISVLATGLAAEVLRLDTSRQEMRRTWLYSLVIGTIMGEVAWALNHLSLGDAAAGILFLLVFYVVSGLALQHLRERLVRRVMVEFIVVSLFGIGLLYLV